VRSFLSLQGILLQWFDGLTLGILISLGRVISKEIHHHYAGILVKTCSLDGVLGDVYRFCCGGLDYVDLLVLPLLQLSSIL
jgi:hypothetical protein